MDRSLLQDKNQRIANVFDRLSDSLTQLEEQRVSYRKKVRVFTIITMVTIIGVLMSIALFPYFYWAFFVIVGIFSIFYYFYVSRPKTALVEAFRVDVVPSIISEFFPEASFEPHECIHSSAYYRSRLFLNSVDKYEGKNLISGCFGETRITFSQLHTQYKTETRTKNGTRTTWHTIFDGVFMIADSNKAFKGATFVLPDKAEKLLGGIGKWFQEKMGSNGRGELVYLENPEFEKKFVVYATDPVEARYLLTPSMQQYFVDLHKHIYNSNLYVSYVGGEINLGLSGGFDLFCLETKKSFNDVETIKYYTKELIDLLKVIEILDLNTRIWGK